MAELDAISKEGVMDLIRESSFAQYLIRQGFEQGFKTGIKKGIEQSTERPFEIGYKRGVRKCILAVLDIRFGLSPSHPMAARIAKIDGKERLNQLLRTAVQAPSLDAFSQLLDEELEGARDGSHT